MAPIFGSKGGKKMKSDEKREHFQIIFSSLCIQKFLSSFFFVSIETFQLESHLFLSLFFSCHIYSSYD